MQFLARTFVISGASAIIGAWLGTANAACPPVPQPPAWNGKPALQVDRDVETCRMFIPYRWDEPFGIVFYRWFSYEQANLDSDIKAGTRVEATDRYLAGVPTKLIEFLNVDLDHYFLALPDEAQTIVDGKAGPGWRTTGQTFTVRQMVYHPFPGVRMDRTSPITTDVWRFYGSVSPGPNSHFFTSNSSEGAWLQQLAQNTPSNQPRWNFEGMAFNVFLPDGSGVCSAGLVPVYRAFNGGMARGIDPNHRYSVDKSTIDGMVSQGWIDEGIAFCAEAR